MSMTTLKEEINYIEDQFLNKSDYVEYLKKKQKSAKRDEKIKVLERERDLYGSILVRLDKLERGRKS